MSYISVTLRFALGAALAQGLALVPAAWAADQTKPNASVPSIVRVAPPQTASIASGLPQAGDTPAPAVTAPIRLSLDAFRAAATDANNDQAGLSIAPAAPAAEVAEEPRKGAEFVPLIKADQPAETNNRATFVQQHEFGVQLKSNF